MILPNYSSDLAVEAPEEKNFLLRTDLISLVFGGQLEFHFPKMA